MTTEQRLERLERENRWMRRITAISVAALLIGGGFAVYHFAMKRPVAVETEATRQARIKAEELAKVARAGQLKAEKNMRRSMAAARAGRHTNNDLQLRIRNPIASVYDDEQKTQAREAEWKSLAREFEGWSKHDLAKEFEAESHYSSLALHRAQEIHERLKNLKASVTDKREKIALMVQRARDATKELQDELGDLRMGRSYEKAVNLCELIATGQPKQEDPFGEIVAWQWVSPIDSSLRQQATEIEEIRKVVDQSRKEFRKERPKILSEAEKTTQQVLAKVAALPEAAGDDEYAELIEELDRLVASFVDDEAGAKHVREIHSHVGAMRKERDRLTHVLAKRHAEEPR